MASAVQDVRVSGAERPADVAAMIDEVMATGRAVSAHVRTLDDAATLTSTPEWTELSARSARARATLDDWMAGLGRRLAEGDPTAGAEALDYLDADPYYFRSGYARDRLAGRLSQVALSAADRIRARRFVVSCVDGERHCSRPGLGRLARSVADNPLRRALRARLHSLDPAVAQRALRLVLDVRKPGLSEADLGAARRLILDEAGRDRFLRPDVEDRARRLWSPEWHAELIELSRHHGPRRTGRAACSRLPTSGWRGGRAPDVADQRRVKRSPGSPCPA